jgi:hypothetical protein
MRVAYQAADASHPEGQSKLAASKGTSPGRLFLRKSAGGESFIGKATPEKGAGSPSRF